MMTTIQTTNQFKKDVKRLQKQGKDPEKLKTVINTLCHGNSLSIHFRDHKLSGNYQGARECHIEPDWLLIYELHEDTIILRRSGSHAELFKM
ncbi:MAG: type II toxin-antitoxin system YafQ family toxin [SAR324 cluster bacterium]|nr:type II toxin-antitoxin system YafQ family toxin [SAR324 cluster bacterium]